MSTNVLELKQVSAGYGSTQVVTDVDLVVPEGSVVALLGPNGAGKTTVMRVAAGSIPVRAGAVELGGLDVTNARPSKRARGGLCLIPEGRGVFPALTVRENLRLLCPTWGEGAAIDGVLDVFPILRHKINQHAGAMSGGQQQMLALARAWLASPSVVLLDEVSMGLAPLIVDEIFEALGALRATGTALLLVEQYVDRALAMADHVYLLSRGTVAYSGPANALDREAVLARYLGLSAGADSSPHSRVP